MSKGSARRPQTVEDSQVEDTWTQIFGMPPLERKRRKQALLKLAEISQELGLYDEFEDKPTRNNRETQESLSR